MNEKEDCQCIDCHCDNKTLSPVAPIIDAEAQQIAGLKEGIAVLEKQIVDLYDHHMRVFAIESKPYRERIEESRKAIAELQRPGCFGKFWEQPEPRTKCDTCRESARCL